MNKYQRFALCWVAPCKSKTPLQMMNVRRFNSKRKEGLTSTDFQAVGSWDDRMLPQLACAIEIENVRLRLECLSRAYKAHLALISR